MREPFTVRLPGDLVVAVRARARDEGASTAEVVAGALRRYLAANPEERAILVSEMEQALVDRLDRRIGRAVEDMRSVTARANFDQSLTLCLVVETLRVLFENDRRSFQRITEEARKHAALRLRREQVIPPEAESAAIAELQRSVDAQRQEAEQLRRQPAGAQDEAAGLRQQLDRARADARHWEERAAWEARRYEWARQR